MIRTGHVNLEAQSRKRVLELRSKTGYRARGEVPQQLGFRAPGLAVGIILGDKVSNNVGGAPPAHGRIRRLDARSRSCRK